MMEYKNNRVEISRNYRITCNALGISIRRFEKNE
jgi:hypothetical protein